MVDASHGHVFVSFGSNNTHTRNKTQQALVKLKLAAGAARLWRKNTCSEKEKACMQSDVAGDVSYKGDRSIALT